MPSINPVGIIIKLVPGITIKISLLTLGLRDSTQAQMQIDAPATIRTAETYVVSWMNRDITARTTQLSSRGRWSDRIQRKTVMRPRSAAAISSAFCPVRITD